MPPTRISSGEPLRTRCTSQRALRPFGRRMMMMAPVFSATPAANSRLPIGERSPLHVAGAVLRIAHQLGPHMVQGYAIGSQ